MTAYKNVAIAGSTGILGPSVVEAFQKSRHFNITLLARANTIDAVRAQFPSVKVAQIDYDSPESLTKALQNQDAVVSALNHELHKPQIALIDAAIKAGVKRFIPSEYGADASIQEVRNVPYLRGKGIVQDYLTKSGLSYTFLYTGPFLEWAILKGFFLNPDNADAHVWNGGDIPIGTTLLSDVGLAIVNTLLKPSETENRHLYVASHVTTQNEILAAADKAGRSGEPGFIRDFLSACLYKFHRKYKIDDQRDNDLLGVKTLSEEEFKQVVAKALN
ncbi:hypothetical protein TRIATDRAFT_80142 [Trichoderma atroviride IMI 206040]|uniref:NmrA-like domain-containing protein n=1 Tax=Hypocrea atroviridis (strain ATCC 20476 / IMI 206040) TaxID=452589 RepID=G9NX27_HYPAI|nr:uncharacterized protein TRIATDRAFT_80142 [Trichoderma atroviride IMI 206040]EHK44680.1 hypothetical protein TRIATDRAFT_80142 [Trichoderma atroviride IMI 206040]